ncbi:hypothetical protein R2B67_24610 [Streptomyces cyaneofuscatus]|uniref:hypothetical protein n=1 Tax=Streptomyces cyaneofuscatus TaxID=66883 RepID=UPI00295442AC|nr:hypothetical protein [Streptomyces cyaneofuscatus]WOP11517.1 hypothetical protein R2B67_24610 [Streptomyces cyaneofuscatus]
MAAKRVSTETGIKGRTSAGAALCGGAACAARETEHRHPLAAGDGICARCRAGLFDDLRRLPTLHEACGEVLGGGRTSEGPYERTSGGPLPGMPFNTAAADARAAVVHVLGAWAGLVSEERRLPPPARDPRALAAFLQLHLDWLCRHPAAPDASREAAGLVRTARRVAEPDRHRRAPVGTCPETGCPGTLRARVLPGGAGEGSTDVRCDADRSHRWSAGEWVRLGQRVREKAASAPAPGGPARRTAPAWLTAADISTLWKVAPGSVYRMASEQGWRRRGHQGRTYYHEGDVLRTLDARRRPGPAD